MEATRPAEATRPSEARPGRNDAEVDNLKIQLGQARRQVELAAIARQSLVEQLDAAQARVDSLEDQLAELQRRLTAAPVEARTGAAEAPRPAVDPRPDATQATVLTLRWELEQTREELRKALGRPVEALEREVAELRARLGSTDPSLSG
jgi:chromosome segregation ATPase